MSFKFEEAGQTYEANARGKAEAACAQFGLPALADDSGLEIDALDGVPGVHSARFMEGAGYRERMQELIRRLDLVPERGRRARFRCCAAIAWPGRQTFALEGICPGEIAREIRGAGGFGYDPIFIPDSETLTFAELPAEVKDRISHRARAFQQVRDYFTRAKLQLD
jgi:XTP/dITP diphosphohydrolase